MPDGETDKQRLTLAAAETNLVTGWDALREFQPTSRQLSRSRIIAADRRDPATGAIDLLRTRVLNAMEERGWRHLGITSPTSGCGVTFMACNLGFSFGRQRHLHTLLIDTNLRDPGIAKALGITDAAPIGPALEGDAGLETRMRRITETFAVAINGAPVEMAAEMLKSSVTDQSLSEAFDLLSPDIVLYDLPPVLAYDDVLSLKHRLDAVLVVVRGGRTMLQEVRDLESLLEGEIPILATVLNEAEDGNASYYVNG